MSAIFQLMNDFDLSIGEIDAITGPLTGKPKSATFRTADVVGLDTLIKVAKGVYDNCPEDERRSTFEIPDLCLRWRRTNGLEIRQVRLLQKIKNEQGKRVFLELDPKTLEYKETQKDPLIPSHKPKLLVAYKINFVFYPRGKMRQRALTTP